jgi:hypothetical protein
VAAVLGDGADEEIANLSGKLFQLGLRESLERRRLIDTFKHT